MSFPYHRGCFLESLLLVPVPCCSVCCPGACADVGRRAGRASGLLVLLGCVTQMLGWLCEQGGTSAQSLV